MPFLKISPQTTVHYYIFNSSAPTAITLLHGLGAHGSSWEFQIQPLIDANLCVICPDLRGFGQSKTTEPTSIKIMAHDVVNLLDDIQVKRTHLVGISMGGTVALQIALDYPHIVNTLVLANTFAKFSASKPSLWLYYSLRLIFIHLVGLPAQAKIVANHIFPHHHQESLRKLLIEQINQSDPKIYRSVMRSLARFNVSNRLKEIDAPTLIISGQEDTTVPLKVQSEMAENLKFVCQAIIPNAGHAASVDSPNIFNEYLIKFITQNSR